MSAFVVPPALTIEKYISRDRYYIVGLKGTGKTALIARLIYVATFVVCSYQIWKVGIPPNMEVVQLGAFPS